MTNSFQSFLLSVIIIHSSPMIFNHGPVVISFDLEKCRRCNSCEALYSSNNINPTQLTTGNIEFNAKSNKGGKIKLNTTHMNTTDKEVDRNQTMITQGNKTEDRSNKTTGINDVEFHNASKDFKIKQGMLFNNTSEFSNENINNFIKNSSNLTLTHKMRRTMDGFTKPNHDKDKLDNKKKIIKPVMRKWSFGDNSDGAENTKSSLIIENQSNSYSELYSNLIDSNEHVVNKFSTTKSYLDMSKIETGVKKNGINKLKMLYNAFKSNTDGNNNISTTQLKATVNKYIPDSPKKETIVLLAKEYNNKSDTRNLSSQITKTNDTDMKVTYINLQANRFNNSNTTPASSVKNSQTLQDSSINKTILFNITKLNATDTKYNNSMKKSTECKKGRKVTWNLKVDLLNKNNKTRDINDRLSNEIVFSIVSNDKHDNDLRNQTDVFEFDIDVNDTTTEFSADAYYRNLYNKMDKIRKTAIDSFIEIDKVSRSKRTQELEALLSRMSPHKQLAGECGDETPTKPEMTEGINRNPLYPHPKLVFNDIYSNMFKPTMLFRNKKDGRLSNLRLNLPNYDMQTQSTLASSSSITPTIPYQYAGTILLLNDKFITSTPVSYSTEFAVTVKPKKEERGLLDLIFPASRVKTFKNLFNAIRRILSHTF